MSEKKSRLERKLARLEPNAKLSEQASRRIPRIVGPGGPYHRYEERVALAVPSKRDPLHLEDIVGLLGFSITVDHLRDLLPTGKRLNAANLAMLQSTGFLCAIVACPTTARLAGFLPRLLLPSLEANGDYALERWLLWRDQVLARALLVRCEDLGEPRADNRMARVAREAYAIGRGWPGAVSPSDLKRSMSSALGMQDHERLRQGVRDELDAASTLVFLEQLEGKDISLFKLSSGPRIRLHERKVRDLLDRELGRTRGKREKLLDDRTSEVDEGAIPNKLVADNHGASVLLAFKQREIRDLRDRAASTPLVPEVLDKLANWGDEDLVDQAAAEVRRLLDELDGLRDPALKAAVIYQWGRGRQHRGAAGSHGAWTREAVAAAFNVSSRQIEARSTGAAEVVDRVHRRPA